jgi:2-oxoglutarate dehydrogenase E1 component
MAQTGPNSAQNSQHAPSTIQPAVNGWQSDFVESLYAQFKADPASVGAEWQNFFRGFELGLTLESADDRPATTRAPEGAPAGATATFQAPKVAAAAATGSARAPEGAPAGATAQTRVDDLITRYRTFGHLASQLDPLGTTRPFPEVLTLEAVGLDDSALSQPFDPGTLPLDNPSPLGDIISCLEETYCGTMGVEFTHIGSLERQAWLSKRLESARNKPQFSVDTKKRILTKLLEARTSSPTATSARSASASRAARRSSPSSTRSSSRVPRSACRSSRSAWRTAAA